MLGDLISTNKLESESGVGSILMNDEVLLEAFNTIDIDGNGRIAKNEMRAFARDVATGKFTA